MNQSNCIVAQSGGPTVAINASLAGVIAGVKSSEKYDICYGAVNGILGILNENYHGAHTIPRKRIAELLRDCRIVLCKAEMPRHGRRGKEKSSHGWRVSTVSSS